MLFYWRHTLNYGTPWCWGMLCALQMKGRGFESTSSHCVATLNKLLTHNCLWRRQRETTSLISPPCRWRKRQWTCLRAKNHHHRHRHHRHVITI